MSASDSDNHLDIVDFQPRCVLEAGVGSLDQSRSASYWETGADCWLFEPNPNFFLEIAEATRPYPNVRVIPVALWNTIDVTPFYHFAQSSFVHGAPMRRQESKRRLARAKHEAFTTTMDVYDPGTFDLALIDVEGAEWPILQHMRSRPALISLELWWPNHPKKRHKHLAQIMAWMDSNGYRSVCKKGRDEFFRREC